MSNATQHMIIEQLSISGTIWGREVTEYLCRAFLDALGHLTAEEVKTAFERCIREERFFPLPAVVLDKVKGPSTEALASLAWSKVCAAVAELGRYRPIQFDDPPSGAALKQVGGRLAVADMKSDQEPFLRMRFIDAYADAVRRGVSENFMFGGLHDGPLAKIHLEFGGLSRPELTTTEPSADPDPMVAERQPASRPVSMTDRAAALMKQFEDDTKILERPEEGGP